MSTKSKFTIIMVLTSLFGAIVFGLLSFLEGRSSLREAAFDELTAIRTARVTQVETYFESVFDEANVITENPLVSDAAEQFISAFAELQGRPDIEAHGSNLRKFYAAEILPEITSFLEEGVATFGGYGPKTEAGLYLQDEYIAKNNNSRLERDRLSNTGGDSTYERLHKTYHNELKFIVDEFEYYDMFLIDHKTGDVVYTVRKEADFATNIYNGPYRASLLGEVVDKVKGDPSQGAVYMSDFEFYLASRNRPAFFVASGIYENDALVGILAIQLTTNDIDSIMTSDGKWSEVGLKESGETYIVGSDYLIRNNSRFAVEDFDNYMTQIRSQNVPEKTIHQITEYKSSLLIQEVKTKGVIDGLAGKSDTKVIDDYRGVPVLSAYAPLSVKGHDFVVLAEMDAAEAFKPVSKLLLNTAVTTAIVIPLSALIGIWVAGFLMRPIRDMRATAKSFLDGTEEVQFQDQKSDEWGQLGQTLNKVLDTAKSRQTQAEGSRKEIVEMTQRLMPNAIGERYSRGETRIVSHEENASAAMMLLTPATQLNNLEDAKRSRDLYEILDDRLDELATSEGVDAINQAGMHYIVFCGLTAPMKNHAERLFRFLVKARQFVTDFNAEYETDIELQIGMDSGPLFGALIGNYSMAYEIWGEAIHRAMDMAHACQLGDVVVSDETIKQIGQKVTSTKIKVASKSEGTFNARHVTDLTTLKLS